MENPSGHAQNCRKNLPKIVRNEQVMKCFRTEMAKTNLDSLVFSSKHIISAMDFIVDEITRKKFEEQLATRELHQVNRCPQQNGSGAYSVCQSI